jgi:glycyl-tRNA synthetase beta chain
MEFLLEIFTEEMPSSHVKAGLAQLEEKLRNALRDNRIAFRSLETYGTCRRLVVVGDFASRQEDREEVVTGPPKAVAYTADGAPTAAALGFARSQNVEVAKLQVMATSRGEYIGLIRTAKGQKTEDILAREIPAIIISLSFPKMMKWGEINLRFSRPIQNVLALWNGHILSFAIQGIQSNNRVCGDKLLSPRLFRVKTFGEYRDGLKKSGVILAYERRKRVILRQFEKRLGPLKARIFPDEELLEKLSYDVEHPYVFRGDFPREYLRLPLEVLSVAMREGQNLFSVVREGRQLPLFLGVADAHGDPKRLIRKGNERVLKARLEDARFFWEQDLKTPLAQRASGLKQVVFQEKLGSYEDKRERLKLLVAYLCDRLGENTLKKEAGQAADLCKVDLLTEMVREFPSLQGRIGGLYAREEGYPPAVGQAIYEHYQPVGLDDSPPSSLAGALLSLADKIDSIVGVAGAGIHVSGSSDPFGLRRNAHGICRIILEADLSLSFSRLLEKAHSAYGGILERPKEEIIEFCRTFFEQRLRFIYETQGYRYDLIGAAVGVGMDDIAQTRLRLKALDALKKSPHFEPFILMVKRVNNILRGHPSFPLNEGLFLDREEKELWSSFSIIKANVLTRVEEGDFVGAQSMAFKLQSPLNDFFNKVLVMAKDKPLRQNRLALLGEISRLLAVLADYSQVVVEGEKKESPR